VKKKTSYQQRAGKGNGKSGLGTNKDSGVVDQKKHVEGIGKEFLGGADRGKNLE